MANGSSSYSPQPPPRADITSSNPAATLSPTTFAIEHGGDLTRVQVKSSSVRNGTGYFCQFRRNYLVKEPYSIDEVDLFAAYIIPVSTWYLIPASVILKPTLKVALTLYPVTTLKQDRYKYEHYREAWGLLGKSRRDLARTAKRR